MEAYSDSDDDDLAIVMYGDGDEYQDTRSQIEQASRDVVFL